MRPPSSAPPCWCGLDATACGCGWTAPPSTARWRRRRSDWRVRWHWPAGPRGPPAAEETPFDEGEGGGVPFPPEGGKGIEGMPGGADRWARLRLGAVAARLGGGLT